MGKSIFSRPGDLIIVVVLFMMLAIALLIDIVNGVNAAGPITRENHNPSWPPQFFYDSFFWWAENYDPLLLLNPMWLKVACWISGFVYAPFYAVAIFAFITEKDWIRAPGLMWATAVSYSLILIYAEALFGVPEHRAPEPAVFLAAYGGYSVFPFLFALRLKNPVVFPSKVQGKKKQR